MFLCMRDYLGGVVQLFLAPQHIVELAEILSTIAQLYCIAEPGQFIAISRNGRFHVRSD